MKVRELMAVLADADPDSEAHVTLDLGEPDALSFHHVREVHETCWGGVEIVVYEAFDVDTCAPWLAIALRGRAEAQDFEVCDCCLAPLDIL